MGDMENLNYLDELARHYPTLAKRREVRIYVQSRKHGKVRLATKHNGNTLHFSVHFWQGEKWLGFNTVGLAEIQSIYLQQQKELENASWDLG